MNHKPSDKMKDHKSNGRWWIISQMTTWRIINHMEEGERRTANHVARSLTIPCGKITSWRLVLTSSCWDGWWQSCWWRGGWRSCCSPSRLTPSPWPAHVPSPSPARERSWRICSSLLETFWWISLYVTDEWWRYCKALCDVMFSQKEGNCRKFSHIELSNSFISKIFLQCFSDLDLITVRAQHTVPFIRQRNAPILVDISQKINCRLWRYGEELVCHIFTVYTLGFARETFGVVVLYCNV